MLHYACLLRTKRCVAKHRLKNSSTRPIESTGLERRFQPPHCSGIKLTAVSRTACSQPSCYYCHWLSANTVQSLRSATVRYLLSVSQTVGLSAAPASSGVRALSEPLAGRQPGRQAAQLSSPEGRALLPTRVITSVKAKGIGPCCRPLSTLRSCQ